MNPSDRNTPQPPLRRPSARRSFESEDAVLRCLYERELAEELQRIGARAGTAGEREGDLLTARSLRAELSRIESARPGRETPKFPREAH